MDRTAVRHLRTEADNFLKFFQKIQIFQTFRPQMPVRKCPVQNVHSQKSVRRCPVRKCPVRKCLTTDRTNKNHRFYRFGPYFLIQISVLHVFRKIQPNLGAEPRENWSPGLKKYYFSLIEILKNHR